MVVLLVRSVCMVSMVLVTWDVTAILWNGCGIQGQNYDVWFQ